MTDGITTPPKQHFENKMKPRPNIHDQATRVASQDPTPNRLGKKGKVI
jgi:hypothetical protein